MRDYTYAEIGMLMGIAVGGIFGAIGFSVSNNVLFFVAAGFVAAAGISIGNMLDKKWNHKE